MKPFSWAFLIDSVQFSKAVVAGDTSLGGSESACLGLARALKARGHDVHVFATRLDEDATGPDGSGVVWHDLNEFRQMNEFIEWDVVCALRMMAFYAGFPIYARMRLLWNQDLLVPGQMQNGAMGISWAVDHLCYVSEYHRLQWEDLEKDLKPIGWVTRNGTDLSLVPKSATKDPNRIIHISRPERGLGPILSMWPKLRDQKPDATLQICRYSSMYDQGPGSWSDTCASYDEAVKAVNAQVGGIEYLGELNKPQLYKAISEAAVMWYPGVSTFAETSCIAAIESQACGTPFVGSLRGALPETAKPSYEAGFLIPGDHTDTEYQTESINSVLRILEGCKFQTFEYRKLQQAGRDHVKSYDYSVIAAEWEAQVRQWFEERHWANPLGVLRQLLHEDDHTAAREQSREILNSADYNPLSHVAQEAVAANVFCKHVIDGKDQGSEDYAEQALADPLKEAEHSDRFQAVVPAFADCTSVLDVACGNGSFAIALCLSHPTVHVYGLDYAQGNIEKARDGAIRAGVADRCTFQRCTVYDFDRHELHAEFLAWQSDAGLTFDGLFVGEFIEHTANYRAVIDGVEAGLEDGAMCVFTCPSGNCGELVPRHMPHRRGHVHKFHHDDVRAVWGEKQDFSADYLASGTTERGNPLGNWLIGYRKSDVKAGERPIRDRILKTRPLQKLSVGILAKDAEDDLYKCLSSVYKVADEIVIGDTGSHDDTKAIAAKFKAKVIDLAPIQEQPEGFAGARNQVLAQCSGDWFLWIDTDEHLTVGHLLRRYLDGQVFEGYVIPQTHLYIDAEPTYDVPVRLFRNTGRVKFYGCVHEQPQDGDANGDIYPTLHVADLKIVHTGYLTQEGREEKRVTRNLPLLQKDAKVFPDRMLGKVLLIREAVIQADMHRARAGGMTEHARRGYQHAIQLYVHYFDDPAHKFQGIVRPWYEAALRHLGLGWELEFSLAGKAGGMGERRAKPERVWVRDGAEYQRLLTHKIRENAKAMEPVTYHTEPFTETGVMPVGLISS